MATHTCGRQKEEMVPVCNMFLKQEVAFWNISWQEKRWCHLLLNMHIKPFGEVAEVALDQAEAVCLKQLETLWCILQQQKRLGVVEKLPPQPSSSCWTNV